MLVRYLWIKFATLLAVFCIVSSTSVSAQTLYRFGQSIQPIFEGFERNADGTFTMWFGYLNRNYDEMPNIIIGENNTFFAADGVDSDWRFSGKVGANVAASEKLDFYGELSLLTADADTSDDNAWGTKLGAKYKF